MELYYFSEHSRRVTELNPEGGEANGKAGWGQLTWRAPKSEMRMPLGLVQTQGKSGTKSKSNFPHKKKYRRTSGDLGGFAGRVTVGDKRHPTCIPANSSKTIIGKVPKVDRG